MLPVNWSNIRPINGSRQEGFEELVCQLARYEPVQGAHFQRKGKPDGGIECFWSFSDGSEWGWQAKYFLHSPSSSQWGQLDRSVKRFLKTHPQMTKMTVSLPVDLPDERSDDRKSAQQRWNEHVKKWEAWARESGRTIEFEYWGAFELTDRLSQDQHRGRFLFWFQSELFSQRWFTNKIEEAIEDAGARYTPALDVTLPIATTFDGLGRTSAFYRRLKQWAPRIHNLWPHLWQAQESTSDINQSLKELQERISLLVETLRAVDESSVSPIDFENLFNLIDQTQSATRICKKIAARTVEQFAKPNQAPQDSSSQYQPQPVEQIKSIRYDLWRLENTLVDLETFLRSKEATVSNVGALLLVGGAGKGKTHLFCDVAQKRNAEGLPTILLLGEHFTEEVWSSVRKLLDLHRHSREQILGALGAAAQVRGRKALILIDALNDTTPPTIWHNRLRSFLKIFEKQEWISVAISVRSSYESLVIPIDLDKDRIVRLEHTGFSGVEYEATRRFFDYYGIAQPSVPLLNPEFQTPLFLKLFCQGLFNQGLTRIPKGLRGITAIFDFFIDSVDNQLQSPAKLNLSPHSNTVSKAIERVSSTMAERTTVWLPITEAEEIVNADLPSTGYTNSLFHHLLSEGVLTKDCFRTNGEQPVEKVRFTYQRLGDHLIAQHLLNRYLTDDPADAFAQDTPLHVLVQPGDHWWQPQSRGLIEALSVQIPEQTGCELLSLVPEHEESRYYLSQAFIESILWRDPKAISPETLKYVNHCAQYRYLHDRFLNILLTVTVDPEHPYNADFLHHRLIDEDMAERDAWWSVFLYEQYDSQGAVDRLVDWAWEPNNKSHIEDESLRLCGTALAWFLTTSHRFLRDRATKALVSMLSDRLHVLRTLLDQFYEVNDLYVLERLLAVAYGCAMRSKNDAEISLLAQCVYDSIFREGCPPAHILLRGYARGVIEYAVHRRASVMVDMEKVRPPYESDWVEIPTKEEIDALKVPDGAYDSNSTGWSQNTIIFSVMDWDFARYVIGADSGRSDWLSLGLDESEWESPKDKEEAFIASLNLEQKQAWEAYSAARHTLRARSWKIIVNIPEFSSEEPVENHKKVANSQEYVVQQSMPEPSEEEIAALEREVDEAEEQLCQLLDAEKLEVFRCHVEPLINNAGMSEKEPRFDVSMIQRWIVKRVFDMGWSQRRFGVFDKYHGQSQRDASKPERVGKKYQWIAYHEILARVADNFQFRATYSRHADSREYKGTWQLNVRNIDPSCILKSKEKATDNYHTRAWWSPIDYDAWHEPVEDIEWIKSDNPLPDPISLIDLTNPADSSQWLALHGVSKWQQPVPVDQDRYSVKRRDIFYLLQGYLVKRVNLEPVYNWAQQRDFFGRWLPEGREFHEIYLGELYWAPAYNYYDDPYMGHWGWQTASHHDHPESPAPILPLSEKYVAESGTSDCSIEDSYSIIVPAEHVVREMCLHWNGVEGHFFNESGQLTAFDPSVKEVGPSALLVRKDAFLQFLAERNYAILWTLLGEKNTIGGSIGPDNWPGRLVISGVYRLANGKVVGGQSTSYRGPIPSEG